MCLVIVEICQILVFH
ncbi:hypothetical protein AVEN_244174-1, partial [Araneus ventricosus]